MTERTLECPRCGHMVQVPTTGEKVRCPQCGQKFRFDPTPAQPAAEQPQPSEPAAEQPQPPEPEAPAAPPPLAATATLSCPRCGIGLGLVNGLGTIGFSVVAPLYGGLVDATGGYGASNTVLLGGAVAMTLIFALFLRECYGEAPDE